MSNKAATISATNQKPTDSLTLGLGDLFQITDIFEQKNILAITDLYPSTQISTQ